MKKDDSNLPPGVCQNCRQSLCFATVDSYTDKLFNGSVSSSYSGSTLDSTWMDHSFVVLPKQKSQAHGFPPRPRTGTAKPDSDQSRKAMEESFVVLPLASRKPSIITMLNRRFDIATAQTLVDQPLCLECMRMLSDKLNKEVEDVRQDIKAYEACLQRLEVVSCNALSEADFIQEKDKAEEEERRLESAIEEADKQLAEVNIQRKGLEFESKRFKELEDSYWHEFNSFQFQQTSRQEERDAILSKIQVSQAHLELLKCTDMLNDAFPICVDGDFGTINNFRLGRLPNIRVQWDEINAAWGQACLLLHVMAQYFQPKFPYRIKILPKGSYPRIVDGNDTYELFGPVNLFWSTRYDKAMTLFLTCLKEFAKFATSKDRENNKRPNDIFKLPHEIENDKVKSYRIALSFNKLEHWTKALKYMLCDLKWVLSWFVHNTNFQPLSAPPASSQTNSQLSASTGKCLQGGI
ncbi:beclin-1-like protein isoform X3 [Magnolia sinica]|nr:beclin-1-like protein isoform X2 [Magnolia sinica]XP_058111154.1 beclin-1-like protein isoform X3 [Magnolia sinica]